MKKLHRNLRRGILSVCAIICGVTASAQGRFPKDFFRFRKIINPDRSYFPELSDHEFLSLRPGPVLYPFILDVWPQQPIPGSPYFSMSGPTYVPDDAVKLQEYIFTHSRNPLERSYTLSQLAYCQSKTAIPYLLRALAREQDPDVTADFLHTLHRAGAKVPVRGFEKYLSYEHKRVRLFAARFYAAQDYADPGRLLELAAAKASPRIRAECYKGAVRHAGKSRFADWEQLLSGDDGEALALVIPALFSFAEINRRQEDLVRWCESACPSLRFAIARHCHPKLEPELAAAMLGLLARDKLSSVRAETATAIGRLKLSAVHPQLLQLAREKRPNVRLRAAQSLRHFPVRASFENLVALTGDKFSPLTRIAARESLIAMAGAYPVEEELGVFIDDKIDNIRLNTCRVLARLQSSRHNRQLEARLQRETERKSKNIAWCIRALAAGGAREAENSILRRSKHAAPNVRASVAEAIGKLNLKKGYGIIENYSLNDKSIKARDPAVIAMGRIASRRFGPTLLTIVRRTDYNNKEFLTGQDRANACWSVSRLQNPGPALIKRLQQLITDKVISTPMGPAYDSNRVRVSACWALATIAKRRQDAGVLRVARQMIKVLSRKDSRGSANAPPTGPGLRCYAYQARQFLDGKAMGQHVVAYNKFRFNLRRAKKAKGRRY